MSHRNRTERNDCEFSSRSAIIIAVIMSWATHHNDASQSALALRCHNRCSTVTWSAQWRIVAIMCLSVCAVCMYHFSFGTLSISISVSSAWVLLFLFSFFRFRLSLAISLRTRNQCKWMSFYFSGLFRHLIWLFVRRALSDGDENY